jgi:hypothetical protein
MERIDEHTFHRSGLRSIVIPSSVVVLCEGSFESCKSLKSMKFETGSRLERIERSAFRRSGSTLRSVSKSLAAVGLKELSMGLKHVW